MKAEEVQLRKTRWTSMESQLHMEFLDQKTNDILDDGILTFSSEFRLTWN